MTSLSMTDLGVTSVWSTNRNGRTVGSLLLGRIGEFRVCVDWNRLSSIGFFTFICYEPVWLRVKVTLSFFPGRHGLQRKLRDL